MYILMFLKISSGIFQQPYKKTLASYFPICCCFVVLNVTANNWEEAKIFGING
jgi:hypothetical protein